MLFFDGGLLVAAALRTAQNLTKGLLDIHNYDVEV